jgi:hypothetical protein
MATYLLSIPLALATVEQLTTLGQTCIFISKRLNIYLYAPEIFRSHEKKVYYLLNNSFRKDFQPLKPIQGNGFANRGFAKAFAY